jgi:hypothetical protein
MHTLKLTPCMCLVNCFDGDCARITLVLDLIHVSNKEHCGKQEIKRVIVYILRKKKGGD